MKYYYQTDSGRVRSHNEDSLIVLENDNSECLMLIADGMGGHRAGEIASGIAVKYTSEQFLSMNKLGDMDESVEWLKNIISEINRQIFKYTEEFPESKGMGTTYVVSLITKEYILIGNIGDSSGYVIRDKKLHKVTSDHTLVNLLLTNGDLTVEEAKNHPRKNILMRALGANDPIEIDIYNVDMAASKIILCSDGLTTMLTDEQIEKVILDEDITLKERIEKLIKKANNRGGSDNISIAVLEKESDV